MKLFNNLYKIILEEVDRSPRKSKSSEPEMPREVAGEIEGVMRELKGEKETPLPTKEEVEGMIILIRKHMSKDPFSLVFIQRQIRHSVSFITTLSNLSRWHLQLFFSLCPIT